MSRGQMITAVALASYALVNIVCSIAIAWAWRRWMAGAPAAASARARLIVQLRSLPAASAAIVTSAAIVPAFAIFEPYHASENAGPLLLLLASIGAVQLAAAAAIAIVTSVRTSVLARAWMRGSEPLDVDPPAGVPAYVIDSTAPVVALVGVFRPTLVAARTVIEACTTLELNAIIAHERGHLLSRDNLKRWLMACAPDALRWTAIHREMASAWHDAAEDAADDAATSGDAASRIDLAALIVKIARLTPAPAWREVTVSPFVEPSGLDRRVRRLLSGMPADRLSRSKAWPVAAMLAAAAAAVLMQPSSLERLYLATEAVIRFGR